MCIRSVILSQLSPLPHYKANLEYLATYTNRAGFSMNQLNEFCLVMMMNSQIKRIFDEFMSGYLHVVGSTLIHQSESRVKTFCSG